MSCVSALFSMVVRSEAMMSGGGLVMFAGLYGFGRWATGADPEILRIVLNSSRFRTQYDPVKWD